MLTITQRLASRLRSVFRQTLNLTSRSMRHPVYLEAGPQGLHIRCYRKDRAAVQYQLDGQQPAEMFAIPFELLSDVEGRKDEPVKLERQQNRVLAQWHDGSVPQLVAHDVLDSEPDDWPPPAESLKENPPRLLKALADACQATDPESSRYVLGCIQLQGKSGKIAATDGRQILLQSDFTFPWEDDVLVPGSKIFGQLPSDQPVFIGRSEKWFVLQTGPWTVWLQLNQEGRFPKTEDVLRRREEATANLCLSSSDRTFLSQNLRRLPCDDDTHDPVTVDLNGHAAIRARQQEGSVTELILSDSPCSGEPIRLNTNRRFLTRAVELDFEQLYAFGPKSPLQCQDEHRQYAWAPLDPEAAIAPSQDAVQIASSDVPSHPSPSRRTRTPMPKTQNEWTTERRTSNGESRTAETDSPANAIEQATALRDTLREATVQAGELIRTLKREKKQAKLVKSTLDSLRQLQEVTG